MNAPSPRVKGWCPGALRPMQSGDGLIVRLKIAGGIVPAPLAAEIARWSSRWGNGEIDLTSRANLQIRGVSAEGLNPLRDAMAEHGLLDSSPEAEAVRNVIASPLAGLDQEAALDICPVVQRLERRLVQDRTLDALPAKFGFVIDDGGRLGMGGVAADIRFEARRTDAGPVFDIRLDGAPGQTLEPCLPDALAETAAGFGRAFLAARENLPELRRMRDWVRVAGAGTIARSLGFAIAPNWNPRIADAVSYLGLQEWGGTLFLGIGLPFGRIAARDLADLAITAQEFRLTPWRTILAVRPFRSPLARGTFILDPGNSLRRVFACVGAPACASATTDVRGDAIRLADFLPEGETLHVSGCAKGCAHPRPASVTLVGRTGRYALVRHGAPWGRPVEDDLSAAEAGRLIACDAATP